MHEVLPEMVVLVGKNSVFSVQCVLREESGIKNGIFHMRCIDCNRLPVIVSLDRKRARPQTIALPTMQSLEGVTDVERESKITEAVRQADASTTDTTVTGTLGFARAFLLHAARNGGRNRGVAVGTLSIKKNGATSIFPNVTEKRVCYPHGHRVVTIPNTGSTGVMHTVNVKDNLKWFSENPNRNVIEVLAFDIVEDNTASTHRGGPSCTRYVHLYTPWYPNGSLDSHRRRLSPGALRSVLLGGWRGLIWLHQNGILHYDIKPANIIIDRQGVGESLTGRIGDIDDVMLQANCQPRGPDIISTPGYGSPFRHCDQRMAGVANPVHDKRRDQVAMAQGGGAGSPSPCPRDHHA